MEPSKPASSSQKTGKDASIEAPSCGLLAPRASRSRLVFWLMIAGVFIVVDLAILFYVISLPTDKDIEQVVPAPAVIEKNMTMPAVPDGPAAE